MIYIDRSAGIFYWDDGRIIVGNLPLLSFVNYVFEWKEVVSL
jgi:hypothetical protein